MLLLVVLFFCFIAEVLHKGNNKITEHRTIFQRERQKLISQQTDKISQQLENWENHKGPDLVQRNCGLEQIIRRQTSRFHYG